MTPAQASTALLLSLCGVVLLLAGIGFAWALCRAAAPVREDTGEYD